MTRLPNQRALKTPIRYLFRNPFRNPLPNPPVGRMQARYLHDAPAPFSGPPSYATLARRFSSSNPSPVSFFAQKKAKENIERGIFVDIHDIGGPDPNDYDVLLTDVDYNKLSSEISQLVGIPYLKEAAREEANKEAEKVHGFAYGKKSRLILPCTVSIEDTARWVFFIVDSGAPITYLSTQTVQAFGVGQKLKPWLAKIAGLVHPVYASPPDSHFADVNLFGIDFCRRYQVSPWFEIEGDNVTFFIGRKNWDVIHKL